jgi:glycosidase
MPLIYSGQEAGNEKALRFFEKDTIDWSQISYQDFYTTLNRLKEQNRALWNGTSGGTMIDISAPGNDNLFTILREKDKNKVVVVINFSDKESVFLANSMAAFGTYKEVFTNESVKISEFTQINMKPWSYLVLTNQE